MTEEPRQLRLERRRNLGQVLRRPDDDKVDWMEPVTLTGRQCRDQGVQSFDDPDVAAREPGAGQPRAISVGLSGLAAGFTRK